MKQNDSHSGGGSDQVRIQLLPPGKVLKVRRGTALQDVLFAQGVEFPCGGRGRCKGCRIKVLQGAWPSGPEEERLLSSSEREDGWRLACRGRADDDLQLELAQWEVAILADESRWSAEIVGDKAKAGEGLGIAIDLGTTTIVAQLLDLRSGHVLAVRTALNAQARHGADVMSRVDFAQNDTGATLLRQVIREQIGRLIKDLLAEGAHSTSGEAVSQPPGCDHHGGLTNVVIVGNTVMHHLFCGLSVESLSRHPFEAVNSGWQKFSPSTLGWKSCVGITADCTIHFLPCLGGFVGSDLLAGILATKLHQANELVALVDLGTNGEIIVANRGRLFCASTAAGPAFEGARISMGMRAATGAISEVSVANGHLHCRVLGNVAPRGICGSGLVDAVAAGLELGWIQRSGRLINRDLLPLSGPVRLTQADIRELQLAKGAIASGLRILVQRAGGELADLKRVYLAGAFGNYINHASARRIGLLDLPSDVVVPAGNTALLGAKLALFALDDLTATQIVHGVEHVSLNEDPNFQDVYVENMGFPG